MKLLFAAALTSFALCGTAYAGQSEVITDDGILNPDELSLNYFANRYDFKKGSTMMCAYGYWATKSGDHADGVKIFKKCADANSDASMIWMSYMYENGYAVEKSPEQAAQWDKRAADRGYKVGEFNYGLSLLRGHGVKQDEAAGREWVNRAAAQGFDTAQELIDSGYDPAAVTPDADEPRAY
jgi:uncharacterized protein